VRERAGRLLDATRELEKDDVLRAALENDAKKR
jgi:hypothetical protein